MQESAELLNDKTENFCSACGSILPFGMPEELCPRCLLGAGLSRKTSKPSHVVMGRDQLFGPFKLGQVLGKGGMGTVYEADEMTSGRRIALKLLSQQLDSPDARRRFLNEGRIAASINHPNSVYVFSTGEITGTPYIAMELMTAGTLQDKVRSQGPLPFSEAVDITMQLIDGLAAAHSAGILHRDIKPSNCFLDDDGSIKIGDYGLSIFIEDHKRADLEEGNSFKGTPTYASPEQMRGAELTLRSDIYSLGATMFFMLTGRPPYVVADHIRLVATVLESPIPDLEKLCPGIPHQLANAMSRCLTKQPDKRFSSYEELRQAISLFGKSRKQPAELWQRLMAGTLDLIIPGIALLAGWHISAISGYDPTTSLKYDLALLTTVLFLCMAVFSFTKWKWGKTPGMALLGMNIVPNRIGESKGKLFLRMLYHTSAFLLLPLLFAFYFISPIVVVDTVSSPYRFTIFEKSFTGTSEKSVFGSGLSPPTLIIWTGGAFLLFSGARRRNNWLALHDRLSGTSITANPRALKPTREITSNAHQELEDASKMGPFYILEKFDGSENNFIGFDPKLMRKVWLHTVSKDIPPVPPAQRNWKQASHLRWIAGVRSSTENWDAYEYPGGKALLDFSPNSISWQDLHHWLADVVNELSANDKPQQFTLDRVWISSTGRAKLLDFPAPIIDQSKISGPGSLLIDMVEYALDNQPVPLPVRLFLEKLPLMKDYAMISHELSMLASLQPEISWSRRIIPVAACAAAPIMIGSHSFWFQGISLNYALFWSWLVLIGLVAIPSIFAAGIIGEGLILRTMGLAIVDRWGRPATYTLAMRRSIIAWMPTIVSPAIFSAFYIRNGMTYAAAATMVVLAILAIASALIPKRSLHDLLARTWLVSR